MILTDVVQGYWDSFEDLPVTITVGKINITYSWTAIRGVQIGKWFFGAIKGDRTKVVIPDAAKEEQRKAMAYR